MDKTYDPKTIETECYKNWEKNSCFAPSKHGNPYCIMLPPPNVTGSLHMGHGFQDTLMDALIRFHRMQGDNVLWQGGTDHAGIATQMVVERQLSAQGKTRHDLGREKFIEKVWEWKEESGNHISKQLRRLGVSIDWSRERFTMDPDLAAAVEKVFIDLFNEGLIYRGKRLVNWDPHLLTAISDLEVIANEEQGSMWYIRYPLADDTGYIVVATTRPETLLGDVAVAVNPSDVRYQGLIGQQLKLPLTQRTIPIISDESVDPEFGTGCVKITPAHDFNDYAMGQRHQLPQINIFTPNAHINENAPTAYQGLERFAARKKIIEDLIAHDLLEKTEPHTLKIPRGDRSGVIIEPYLTDQWFMKMQPLAKPAIEAVRSDRIKFYPENWSKTYFQWLENIEDWCISRQLWWGHRVPAWYDENNHVYVGSNEKEVREKYQLAANIKLTQDSDVLDTWFSSALWPFATLGWPEKTYELNTYYPTSVLVTGFDIIFFWVARMIMLGIKFMNDVPFKAVYVHGLIRDNEGQKMSKSKGNVLDPIDLIDGIDLETLLQKRTTGLMQPEMARKIEQTTRKQYPEGIPAFGTDALRFTYCALASNNRDIRFDLNRVEGYRNFCNKLWNAARFVLMHTEDKLVFTSEFELNTIDQWIYSELQKVIHQVHDYFKEYRFDLIAQTLYQFVWDEYCDWYLELAKVSLNNTFNPKLQNGTRATLIHVLEIILRLLHPMMPYITEEIWQRVAPLANIQGKTIMQQPYPVYDTTKTNSNAEEEVSWLKQIILAIRKLRSENNISPAKKLPLLFTKASEEETAKIKLYASHICLLSRIESVNMLLSGNDDQKNYPLRTIITGSDLELILNNQLNPEELAEQVRHIQKDIEKKIKERDSLMGRLNSSGFKDKAPVVLVTQTTDRINELSSEITKLNQQLSSLKKATL